MNMRTCETRQRAEMIPLAAAPYASLPVLSECWEFMSMDFVFGLPNDSGSNTRIVVFVDRLGKMDHVAAVPDFINGKAK